MPKKSPVFEKNYDYYLRQISTLDLKKAATNVGADYSSGELAVPLYNEPYRVSEKNVLDKDGNRPPYTICVVLFKYILMNSDLPQKESEWTAYREFKDAGPLVGYFTSDVEKHLERHFAKRVSHLKTSCKKLGGKAPGIDISHDAAFRFQALPRVPMLLLFNDRDEEFPASCSVLFQRSLEKYLDMESVAILGQIFSKKLIELDEGV